jgi:UDP-2-acetamido-3-amino-2,3-dideoxy-glucuronate N-acetyltransferase
MKGYVAHPTAEIAEAASIGDGTRIWQYCIVMGGAQLGRDCKLGHNVFIEGDVVIGDRVVIKDNVCLYDGVQLADDVFIGPNAVFTNVRTPRAFVSRKSEFEATFVDRGATIGANATIVCGNRIGDYAMVGAGAVVTADVVPHSLVAGNPARHIAWVSKSGEVLGPELICPRTREKYAMTKMGLTLARD